MKKIVKSRWFGFLAGCILGMIIFMLIYGVKIINPAYEEWIYQKSGDINQHYIGWQFYRKSNWSFPIGLIEGLSEQKVSMMYTDSIPLFAVFFKILSPLLPETFQYMGLWGVFCFAMQGGLGTLITSKLEKEQNVFIDLLGGSLFILSETVIQRMFGHSALGGQWLILLFIWLWLCNDEFTSVKRVIYWTLTSMLAVSVHPYFVPMCYFVMFGALLYDLLENREIVRDILVPVSSVPFTLLLMWINGAFYGGSSFSGGGLGQFSANLNTLINPMGEGNSLLIKPLPTIDGQGEGYAYLGAGIIFGAVICIVLTIFFTVKNRFSGVSYFFSDYKNIIIPVVLVVAISSYLAFFPVLTLNDKVIFTFSYPAKITELLSIFRASGRFMWLTLYGIIVGIIAFAFRKLDNRKVGTIFLILCLAIQITDMTVIFKRFSYYKTEMEYTSPLKSNRWEELGTIYDEICFVPEVPDFNEYMDNYYAFAIYAVKHDMNMSSFIIARLDFDRMKEYTEKQAEKLAHGKPDENKLYVVTNNFAYVSDNIITEEFDGYMICHAR